jgi:DNA mismatch repair ATPase MutS
MYTLSIFSKKDYFGLAFADITTGEFHATEIQGTEILKAEILRINPEKIIVSREHYEDPKIRTEIIKLTEIPISPCDFNKEASQFLKETLHVSGLEGFGIGNWPFAIQAAAVLMHHLIETEKETLRHIDRITAYTKDDWMHLDESTLQNLEILTTLLPILDQTKTPMGGRMLRDWALKPLLSQREIRARHESVEEFTKKNAVKSSLQKNLEKIADLEHLLYRINSKSDPSQDIIDLGNSLKLIPEIKDLLVGAKAPLLKDLERNLVPLNPLVDLITQEDRNNELNEIREQALKHIRSIKQNASTIAQLDVLLSFAQTASQENYCRPLFTGKAQMEIENDHHPVHFDAEKTQFKLITGPNTNGKSTYLRQVAFMAIMAQIGSFIPAKSCTFRPFDRIFLCTEIQETSEILSHATPRSLIILDEIGHNTSTTSGLSLTWAIMEFIHDTIHSFTLFATHYHELITLADRLTHAKNYSIQNHKLKEGSVSKNHEIETAHLAGLPNPVIERANMILSELEKERKPSAGKISTNQMGLFHPALEKLKELDINSLTPIEALHALDELKNIKDE